MSLLSYIKIVLISIPEASNSISKVFVKLGKASNEAEISFSFNKLKDFSCSFSHLKPIVFFTISINGEVIVLKSLTILL